ncbi:MAG: hypothetical protein ACLGJC_22180 [Alphaproteobacteria bacterium]
MCRDAVTRAYRALVANGVPHRHAVEAAAVIHHWHHPDTPLKESVDVVETWVMSPTLH